MEGGASAGRQQGELLRGGRDSTRRPRGGRTSGRGTSVYRSGGGFCSEAKDRRRDGESIRARGELAGRRARLQRLDEPGKAQSSKGSMRSVLGDAESLGELADRCVRNGDAAGRSCVGDEGLKRSPSEWAERAPRLIGHRAEQKRVPTLVAVGGHCEIDQAAGAGGSPKRLMTAHSGTRLSEPKRTHGMPDSPPVVSHSVVSS